jgi:hypothetical protein
MKRLLSVGLALLLAGCVTTGDSGTSGSAGTGNDAAYQKDLERVGKTYWIDKYKSVSACLVPDNIVFCKQPKELGIETGPIKFESLQKGNYFNIYYITWGGGAGWALSSAVHDYTLLDKPRNEKHVGGPVKIGMTKQQVIDSDLGLPDAIKSWTGKDHVIDHWSYRGTDHKVIFFEDGRVTVIKQD